MADEYSHDFFFFRQVDFLFATLDRKRSVTDPLIQSLTLIIIVVIIVIAVVVVIVVISVIVVIVVIVIFVIIVVIITTFTLRKPRVILLHKWEMISVPFFYDLDRNRAVLTPSCE